MPLLPTAVSAVAQQFEFEQPHNTRKLLVERVYERRPNHMSTTRVGAVLPMPSCLGIGGTPAGPGKDTHGTLGPEQRGGLGWPDTEVKMQ